MSITIARETSISLAEFRQVLNACSLGSRRPIDDEDCLQGMLANSNCIISARDEEKLIGVARSLTDFHYCCYLSDLAVDDSYQRQGIGLRLIEETRKHIGPRCKIILLSAPQAVEYYPHIGFSKHEAAFTLAADAEFPDKPKEAHNP